MENSLYSSNDANWVITSVLRVTIQGDQRNLEVRGKNVAIDLFFRRRHTLRHSVLVTKC